MVSEYLQNLDHPLKNLVEELRQLILATHKEIGEQIKWNSPSFYYTGEMKPFDPKTYKRDIVVLNLHKKDQVLLVFPTGASIDDQTGLLEGKFSDTRKVIPFKTMKEIHDKKGDLQTVIKQWLTMVEKP
ncbi:MAG: DUF1801 domain-containing protein [Candidatus Pedobacter colombiensis]|uniref:DUF1801 domain-containing protein n=1 Tax=Candidatus Pedobacter colombiensis TaxID=3121371 RepID=A0AAJ5W529_9SPHI|nr:DUF1801 domain-containing protein [Pedobacter sp.]WEK18127.1 MAG: DUF1801 domain-containing protein [Pedobacter sp.]